MSRRGEARTVSLLGADYFIKRSWRNAMASQSNTFVLRFYFSFFTATSTSFWMVPFSKGAGI